MKFSEITNRTCLYLLGGIAGMEGPKLNIIQTQNGKLFFEFNNNILTISYMNEMTKTETTITVKKH